jgi:hypothetical protein
MTQATDMALARTKRIATRARSTLRRKNLILDQAKIDRAKRNLRAATETDTIHRALDAVNDLALFRREVNAGLDGLLGRGGFADFFAATEPSP